MGLHGFNGFCGVSVLPHSSWPLSLRQMGDKSSPAGPAQQEGMAGRAVAGGGRGLATQASLGGAAAGKPLGAHPEQPINPGDLRAAGSLPTEVSQGSRLVGRGRCLGAPVPHEGPCQGPSPRARPSRLSQAEPADE